LHWLMGLTRGSIWYETGVCAWVVVCLLAVGYTVGVAAAGAGNYATMIGDGHRPKGLPVTGDRKLRRTNAVNGRGAHYGGG